MRDVYFDDSYAHYAQAGETGPAVVILHGWAASLNQWAWILPTLARAGYTAYALDLPGHGRAPRLSPDHTIQDYVEYVHRWTKALKIGHPILLGHSMGGYLSLRYALDHPGTARGLILVDPLYSYHQFNRYHQLARWLLSSPKLLKLGEILFGYIPTWLVQASHHLVPHDIGAAPAAMRRQVALDHKQAHPQIVRTIAIITDLRPRLHQLRVPASVVWGGHDHLLSPASFETLVDLLPMAQGRCFVDVGHHPHLTRAQDFVDVVLAFLRQVEENRWEEVSSQIGANHLWMTHTNAIPAGR